MRGHHRAHAAESQLREQRALLANVIEGTHAGIWRWNVATRQCEINDRWAGMAGCTVAELAPITIQTWVALIHPGDLQNSDAARDAHFNRTADNYECEFRMKHKDGSWVWVEDRGKVVEWSPDGKPLVMAGTHLDITARKQAEHQLGERVKELQAFFGLAELQAKLGITLAEIYQDFANLLPASWQYPEIACARIQMGDHEFCTSNFKPSAWMQSEPIKVNEAVVGRVEVGYLEARPEADAGPFLQEEQTLLTTLAKQIGTGTQHRQAEDQARQLAAIVESSHDAIIGKDLNGVVQNWNRGAEAMFGYAASELIGASTRKLLPLDRQNEEERSIIRRSLERAGYAVREAGEGGAALKLLASAPADVVITDLVMPDMEGIALILSLRKSHPQLPVIAMSGGGGGWSRTAAYLDIARNCGAARILANPFDVEELLGLVQQLLGPPPPAA